MLIKNKYFKFFGFLISFLFLAYLFYLIISSFFIVKNQFTDIGDSTYVNQIRLDDYTKRLSSFLIKDCKNNELCEVQTLLDFVTKIPYKINKNIAKSSKQVIKQNYGDCDDKSNLLISMLKLRAYEVYFVLVPKHIFVIVNLKKKIANKKALYVNGKKFYILESTAKNSKIAFPLRYKLNEIEAILDPFKNEILDINNIEYK
ncbi:MAG: hypothetical protein HRT40_05950 [Campylobacteraceae bacterium]|nr:hypothetical protein [Campylobacteraceae bacterium]